MYHHDATIEYFKGKWIALWNANKRQEGTGGQGIYMSTSNDLKAWSFYILAFSSFTKSTNPVKFLHDNHEYNQDLSAMQWQPGLIKLTNSSGDMELWALWRQNGGDKNDSILFNNRGIWKSTLKDPNGRWINEKILFNGKKKFY